MNDEYKDELNKITRKVIIICTGICVLIFLISFFLIGSGLY